MVNMNHRELLRRQRQDDEEDEDEHRHAGSRDEDDNESSSETKSPHRTAHRESKDDDEDSSSSSESTTSTSTRAIKIPDDDDDSSTSSKESSSSSSSKDSTSSTSSEVNSDSLVLDDDSSGINTETRSNFASGSFIGQNSASPSSTSDASKEDDESNVGTIAGIAVVGVLCIMAILGFVLWKKRQRARRSRPQNSSNDNDDDWAFGNGSVHDEKRSYNSSAESIHMTEMPLTPPSVPPRSANPFLAPSEPPDSPWAAPVGMAYGSGPSSAAHSLRNYPATHQSGNPSISSHRSAGPATELPYSNATPMPPAPSPVPAPLPYQPLTTTQQQQMHQQNSNLIAQPEPFRPMSQSFVTAAGLVASPAVSSEEEATGLRSPHDVSPRDSKYISGYSSTSIDEPGMASAFPAPPKPEEPLPALPDEQRRQSTSTEATARPMSYTDPIPRSLTPGGTPLHRPSMIHLDSSVARPVSQYSDTTTYETATSEIQHLYERDSIDYRRNTNQHFFLPPLQIPASGAQENDAAESLDQDLTPPSRPFAASPVEPASISAVSPKSNSPATSSPVGRVASPLKESSNEQEAIVGKERSGTLTKNPFVLGADDSTARDSFDLTSHYYYGDATTPQGGDDKRESTEVLAPAAQPRPQNRESLYRPVRVSGSDWGFLNDLLEDPQVTGQQGGKDVGK